MNFHRNWKRILNEREKRLQCELRNENHNGGNASVNESEPTFEIRNDDTHYFLLGDQLKFWVLHNSIISMRCMDGLLEILRTNGHPELPKSYRTLLSTPRNIELATFGDSKYWYRGLADSLKIVFVNLDRDLDIELKFNIDGLPIFISSRFQFWPILASVERAKKNSLSQKYYIAKTYGKKAFTREYNYKT